MSALDRIKSRPPTGKVPWPCILIEGEEKAGKTYRAYELTKSDLVGRSFVIDLGEASADEYGPIGNYEIVEHDGTFGDVYDQVCAIHEFAGEQLAAGEKPVVLIIDTMSDEWSVLKTAITAKAARSESNKKRLREDPSAEVKVPNLLWNDANAKHRRLMTKLLTFPGIVVMTARGKQVASIGQDGKPVEGVKEWKVEGQYNLAFDASAWIRMKRNEAPTLEGARSLYCGIRPGKDPARELPEEFEERGLEWFIFEALRVDPATAHVRDLRDLTDDASSPELPEGVPVQVAEEFLRQRVIPNWQNVDALDSMVSEVVVRGIDKDTVGGPDGQPWALGDLIVAQVNALRGSQDVPAATQQASPPASPPAVEQPVEQAESPVLALLERVKTATNLEQLREVWRESGVNGLRAQLVPDPVTGEDTPLGKLIMEAQQKVAAADVPEPGPVEPDAKQRAAGEAVPAGTRD